MEVSVLHEFFHHRWRKRRQKQLDALCDPQPHGSIHLAVTCPECGYVKHEEIPVNTHYSMERRETGVRCRCGQFAALLIVNSFYTPEAGKQLDLFKQTAPV